MPKINTTERKSVSCRLDADTREWLESIATAENRSLSNVIASILEEAAGMEPDEWHASYIRSLSERHGQRVPQER